MGALSQADQYLLEQIRSGQSDAWSQLVGRYQGRLVAFARARLRNAADAEDLVQEAFLSFLKSVGNFRGEASLETYLFTILRRKIIDHLRGRRLNICLIQDLVRGGDDAAASSMLGQIPADQPAASWYVRRGEQHDRQRRELTDALTRLVSGMKQSLNFRDLKIVEMLLYCQLRNKDAAPLIHCSEKQIALIKHRCLKQVRQMVSRSAADSMGVPEALITEIWEAQRLSCPKRSTIGAYLLGTLEGDWSDYVQFHIERLGCRFCRANLDDLKRQTADAGQSRLRDRILQSTVGFLRKA